MAMQEKNPTRLLIPQWHRATRETFESDKIGAGAVGLLSMINLLQGQSAGYVADLSGDQFIARGLGSWHDDWSAVSARLTWMVAKLGDIAASGDPDEVKLVAIYNYVARPVLDGNYPADMIAALPAIAQRGIRTLPDGSGTGFGDAVWSATLWNQAVVAGDLDRKLGAGWARDAVRSLLTQVATQLERSAPGDAPTAADLTVGVLQRIAKAPGQILAAVGGPNLMLWAGVAVAGGVALFLVTRE